MARPQAVVAAVAVALVFLLFSSSVFAPRRGTPTLSDTVEEPADHPKNSSSSHNQTAEPKESHHSRHGKRGQWGAWVARPWLNKTGKYNPRLTPLPLVPGLLRDPAALSDRFRTEPGLRALIGGLERMVPPAAEPCVPHGLDNPGDAAKPGELCLSKEVLAGEFKPLSLQEFLKGPPLPDSPAPPYDLFVDYRALIRLSDFVCDNGISHFRKFFPPRRLSCTFPSAGVFNRSLIYLAYDDMHHFRAKFLRMNSSFFLISTFHDHPRWPEWLLDSPLLLRWFTCNVPHTIQHTKIVPLPLGVLVNASHSLLRGRNFTSEVSPDGLLFAKFDMGSSNVKTRIGGRWERRRPLLTYLRKNGFNITQRSIEARVPHQTFLRNLLGHKYVLCPAGEGLDSYRLWETLYLGRVPVIGGAIGPYDSGEQLPNVLLEDLPIYQVADWEKLTPGTVEAAWSEIAAPERRYNGAKLWLPWWAAFILRHALEVA